MIDASCEVDLGGLEGVVGREVDGEEEDTARVGGVTLKTRVSIKSLISSTLAAHRFAARGGRHRCRRLWCEAWHRQTGSI